MEARSVNLPHNQITYRLSLEYGRVAKKNSEVSRGALRGEGIILCVKNPGDLRSLLHAATDKTGKISKVPRQFQAVAKPDGILNRGGREEKKRKILELARGPRTGSTRIWKAKTTESTEKGNLQEVWAFSDWEKKNERT